MARSRKTLTKKTAPAKLAGYEGLFADVARVIEEARHSAVRTVNAVMTATYWLVGRRIVEAEQAGETRAEYGKEIVDRLSADLTERFGRGFGRSNLFQMRAFFLARRNIVQTASGQSPRLGHELEKVQTATGQLGDDASLSEVAACFPLPWSHYVRLLAVKNSNARAFYEDEALRGGWTVRQLDRQIQSQFYERTALSRNKAAMLTKGAQPRPEDHMTPEEEIKDPYVLELGGFAACARPTSPKGVLACAAGTDLAIAVKVSVCGARCARQGEVGPCDVGSVAAEEGVGARIRTSVVANNDASRASRSRLDMGELVALCVEKY